MLSSGPPAATAGHVGKSAWTINRRVVGALVLREMLTRYGRNNIGFLWLFVEPILFTLVVVSIKAARIGIYDHSIPGVAFAVTGWPALMLWRNMPNRCMGALKSNRNLLHHRQVSIPDIFMSRIILEFMATSTSFVFVTLCLYSLGALIPPEDILQVIGGWMLLAWFGTGLAFTLGSVAEGLPVFEHLWKPISYLMMPLSGVAFVVEALPPKLREIALWVPQLNCVEFIRDGWFGSRFHAYYDIPYVLLVNLCLTFVGLSLLRQVGLQPSEE
jgi:ABC-type polysaccharide/polyol phosphate export permease